MVQSIFHNKRTILLNKKHLQHHGSSANQITGQGLALHHIAHQMKNLKIGGAILKPDVSHSGLMVVDGRGTSRHQKPLSLDDFKKKPIAKIF